MAWLYKSEARLSSLPPPTEYQPRKRASKHLEELASLRNESDEIVNVVPPFKLSDGVQSWDEFNQELEEYKRKNHLKFRIRRSEKRHSTTRITHEDQMPTVFEWTHKIYRCTHGVTQGSRSKGHRNQQSRYNDCKARITAVVTRESGYTHKIVIRNENHTHSHPRGPTQTSSYLTTNAMPLDEQNREVVKTLADARVSSSHIARLLNDRIGCKVTPQQARNFIRSITGEESGEDQMDVTCGVVMQTKVQKLMFERWGETLAMDFTHGTNNRVYHLGSLVVTTATGRGFPVVDFICLNEQAATTSTVLEYFKEKNPRWKDVTTVVIDKDFVEWQVLEKCFPNTNIFLCQFHAISYWKKVMKRPAYRLKMSQREELLQMMTKLLYRFDVYKSGYQELKRYCTVNKRLSFFAYFEKNWNSCRVMWANFARGKHFTAGNTTTNRIESNWNQLKMLLGMKTRIEKTIAGLLQHQMTITEQIVSELDKQHSSSRLPRTVPLFLRAVASRLSNNMLEKVKKEWEGFVNQADVTSCEQSLTSWVWNVHCSHQTFRCHDLDWVCTCLFYTSNHLPCRHLMLVASKYREHDKLPANAIHNRWSTVSALDIKDELVIAAASLQKVVSMSKLRLPKRLPNETDETEASASTKGVNEIVYVRLRRNERANKIVIFCREVLLREGYAGASARALVRPIECEFL
ncbi:hypothetical protein F444_05006 [Phytophthora nicotianae P1976]|uniref:SWIM-type domain-containing protein n=1 Tax=Phytophthora nicotianae P1976 TaxID=1317066 RepID=A0A081ANS6_PHYNI|nr:hypothetical protein F444_05006 [Phytophthora nicotianae P1976]